MRIRPYILFVAVLLGAMLACTVTDGGIPDPHAIETNVAATLTMLAGGPVGGGPESTPTETLPPDSPAPAETATSTITPPPPPHLRVVYVSGGNIYLKDLAAAPVQLTFAGGVEDVRISDDGMKIAYTKRPAADTALGIGVINSDGTDDHIVVPGATIASMYPLDGALFHDIYRIKFIPGTHRVLFNTRRAFDGPGLLVNDDVVMVDLDSGGMSTVLARPDGGDFYPSPDATKLAISRAENISLANIDGSGYMPNAITFPFILTYSEYAYYPPVVWRADSSEAGVIIPSPEQLAPGPSGRVFRIQPITGATTLAATTTGQFLFPQGIFSPDLLHYSYSVLVTDTFKELHVANTADASSLHLADGPNQAVESFSPDGAWFIYYQGDPRTFYVGSLGGGTMPLGPLVMDPIWVNASQFVYLVRSSGAWSINLGGTDGTSSVLASGAGPVNAFDADE